MIKIEGLEINKFPAVLTPVADLIFDEFLFLRLLRTKKGESYLQYWYDRIEGADRWVYVKVPYIWVSKYLKGDLSLLSLLKSTDSPFVYLISETFRGEVQSILVTTWDAFPADTLPSEDSLYTYEPIPLQDGNRKQYCVNMAGEWAPEELAKFLSYFKQAYAFIAFLKTVDDHEHNVPEYHMNEGLEVFRFFERIKSNVRDIFKLTMLGATFASPGSINFEMHSETCDELIAMLQIARDGKSQARDTYINIRHLFAEHKLVGKSADSARVSVKVDRLLGELAVKLLSQMGVPEAHEIFRISSSGFLAAQRSSSYYRLVRHRLYSFWEDDKIDLARTF